MTDPEPLGTVVADGDTFTVHFERRLAFPIDEVWAGAHRTRPARRLARPDGDRPTTRR